MAKRQDASRVVDPAGRTQTLGEFLAWRRKECGLSVTKIVEIAGISRANYYMLEKGQQRPGLVTLTALLGAMGLEARIPGGGDVPDPDGTADLLVDTDGLTYTIDLGWSSSERDRSRIKYLSNAAAGLNAALTSAALAAKSDKGVAMLASAGAVASLGPFAGPAVAGIVVATAARGVADRRSHTAGPADLTREQLLSALHDETRAMSAAELEVLLTAVRAMRNPPAGVLPAT